MVFGSILSAAASMAARMLVFCAVAFCVAALSGQQEAEGSKSISSHVVVFWYFEFTVKLLARRFLLSMFSTINNLCVD